MAIWLAACAKPGPSINRVIIIGISKESYSVSSLELQWKAKVAAEQCWGCGTRGCFARHGRYEKYFFGEQIEILRVRCTACSKTHALVPEFSAPRSSIGMLQVQEYLYRRSAGISRPVALQAFAGLVHADYGRWLDRKLVVLVNQAKALWPDAGDLHSRGLAWIASVVGTSVDPLIELNRYALSHRVNCLWFSRRLGACDRRRNAGRSGFT